MRDKHHAILPEAGLLLPPGAGAVGYAITTAGPRELIGVLREKNAPDGLTASLERLPGTARYGTAHELAEAVVGAGSP